MNTKNIAINGFGRMGRLFLRALFEKGLLGKEFNVVAVNDLEGAENLAYLLKYDTIHGRFPAQVKYDGNDKILISDEKTEISQSITVINKKVSPSELPWSEFDVDIVIEGTGVFRTEELARGHISAGAKKVLITAPSDEQVFHMLIGVNEKEYSGQDIVSNASCTTNGLAPLVKILLDSSIGIEEGFASTIHSYTADQALQDSPKGKDFRRGRAAAMNIVPTSSGAAKAITTIYPELKGKITAAAFRVPVADVSVIDFSVRTEKSTSIAEINSLIKQASLGNMKGVLEYTEEEAVSSDFIHTEFSAIYDAKASIQLNDRFFKLVAWYDNEWGYVNRLVDSVGIIC